MRHLSEDSLNLYALEILPEAEVAPLEEHLLICHDCQDRLQLTDDFIAALRDAVGSRRIGGKQPGT